MMNPAVEAKRRELQLFIERVLKPEPSVQGVVGIGSIASGQIGPDSDIDVVVFLDPLDWYVIPAEFIWLPADGTFHDIFTDDPETREKGIEFDCLRLSLAQWANPGFDWPEPYRAEFGAGWMAFDRHNEVAAMIAERTAYSESLRQKRLDDAITWLDQHLGGQGPEARWDTLGPLIAHDRLQAAYEFLVRALFAYNRMWLPWRNRQMDALLKLEWLPPDFEERVSSASGAAGTDFEAYNARVSALRALFDDLLTRVVEDGIYSSAPIDQAFVRSHDEPGYAWNMDDWKAGNLRRFLEIVSESPLEEVDISDDRDGRQADSEHY